MPFIYLVVPFKLLPVKPSGNVGDWSLSSYLKVFTNSHVLSDALMKLGDVNTIESLAFLNNKDHLFAWLITREMFLDCVH